MKINKFNEDTTHLHNNHNAYEGFTDFFDELLGRFFDAEIIDYSELFKSNTKDSNDLTLTCEFIAEHLDSDKLKSITKYIDFVNNYGGSELYTNDTRLGVEVKFFEHRFDALDPKLNAILATKKFNI